MQKLNQIYLIMQKKLDLKYAAGVDTSGFAKRTDLGKI